MIRTWLLLVPFLQCLRLCSSLQFNVSSIQSDVFDQTRAAVVVFVSGEEPEFIAHFGEKMETYGITVGSFDCEPKAHQKICKAAGVAAIPQFNLYTDAPQNNPYTKKNFREFTILQGVTDDKSFEKAIGRKIPYDVKIVSSSTGADNLVAADKAGGVLLFTTKSTVSFLFRAVSYAFRGHVDFIQVKDVDGDAEEGGETAKTLAETYGVDTVPSIGVLVKGDFAAYDGDLKSFNDIVSWISEKTGAKSAASKMESVSTGGGDASSAGGSAGGGLDIFEVISSSDLNTLFQDGANHAADDGFAYVVAVPSPSAPWNVPAKCVGAVRCVQLKCADMDNFTPESPSVKFCENQGHMLVVPYSISSRKSVLSSTSKWSFSPEEIDTAVKRATESIPDDIMPTVTETNLDSMIIGPAFAEGFPVIVALSNRDKASALLRNVAASSKSFARMGFYPNPADSFLQNIGSAKLPTVIGLMESAERNGQKELQVMVYDPAMFGPMNFNSIMTFIVHVERQAASFRGGDSSRTQPQSRPDISNRKGPVELMSVTSADEWEKMCGETFKGICAIAFMGAPEGVDPADAANLEQMQKAMDAMDLTSAYNFVWVDASCQTKLAELFDVSGGSTPALAVYSPLKNRFAKYIGSFSKDSIRTYLDNMAAGRISTFDLPARPVYDSEVECLSAEALVANSSGDDFDADDFLAEMQREEAEKEAQLKKQLEEEKKEREAAAEKAKKDKTKKKKKKKKTSKKSEL